LAKIHGEFLFCFSRTNMMRQSIFTWAQLWKTFTAHSWTCQDFVPTFIGLHKIYNNLSFIKLSVRYCNLLHYAKPTVHFYSRVILYLFFKYFL
jgi:hypothetical protein